MPQPARIAATLVMLALGALAASSALASPEPLAAPSWDACERSGHESGHYHLGRYAHGLAIVEVRRGDSSALARLWARAQKGGSPIAWPGGRLGVRHLDNQKSFAEATPLARSRLYVWEGLNGWGSTLAPVIGVELAKSLCDANTIVVYLVLKFDQPGEGFAIASSSAPAGGDPLPTPVDPPKRVIDRLYTQIFDRLKSSLRAQKLAPSQLQAQVLVGHFTGPSLEYAVSLKWQNTYADRFSVIYLADPRGEITQFVDQQEGGAGGILTETADLGGDGIQDVIYELTTLDGSSAALWSLRGGKLEALVQTTPVGE